MPRSKTIANIEVRPSPLVDDDERAAAALDAALTEAKAQTPEGTTTQVAFVLAWIDGVTFVGRVAVERDRYAGLKAQVLKCWSCPSPARCRASIPTSSSSLRGTFARVPAMADVQELLQATRARAEALAARTAPRSKR